LFTCGQNSEGQLALGHNNKENKFVEILEKPFQNEEIKEIRAGYHHILILTEKKKEVYACG
jgi:alpha-tubulin suppressor-like RCC1 family protein